MAKSSNGNSRDYYSFGEGTREYLYNVARIYDIIREGCTFSNGKGEDRVEFAIEGEGKKLFALYLAAGIGGKYFFGSPKIYSSDAYDIHFLKVIYINRKVKIYLKMMLAGLFLRNFLIFFLIWIKIVHILFKCL